MSAQGRWRHTGRHHSPDAVATHHVIETVTDLAVACSILAPEQLQHRANTILGLPTTLPPTGVRLDWAAVHVTVSPADMHAAKNHMRLQARIRAQQERRHLQMTQAAVYRDQLREDPTLVLAQLLLESPQSISDETVQLIPKIAKQAAAYAPGAAWVQTARMLDQWFGPMDPDAKQFIIDRLSTLATEFGADQIAQRLKDIHQSAIPDPLPAEPGSASTAVLDSTRMPKEDRPAPGPFQADEAR
ncbi:hypothetical protein ACFCX6_21960 [Streptomyces sp. NPDC056353]|uniref:hypothetical protein n=1 Tax=Streptomyces sp. NPDC056353 TaxID=3345792 RepID=UPI0035DD52DE